MHVLFVEGNLGFEQFGGEKVFPFIGTKFREPRSRWFRLDVHYKQSEIKNIYSDIQKVVLRFFRGNKFEIFLEELTEFYSETFYWKKVWEKIVATVRCTLYVPQMFHPNIRPAKHFPNWYTDWYRMQNQPLHSLLARNAWNTPFTILIPVQTARTCSPAARSEDNRVEPAVVGGQEVRADVHHFRLQAAGHRYLVEERSAFAGDEGDGKYQPAPRH